MSLLPRFFSIVIHAHWSVQVPFEFGDGEVKYLKGLFAARRVAAASYEQAVLKVKARVLIDLDKDFSDFEGYVPPTLEVDQAVQINCLKFLFPLNSTKGFTAYTEDS